MSFFRQEKRRESLEETIPDRTATKIEPIERNRARGLHVRYFHRPLDSIPTLQFSVRFLLIAMLILFLLLAFVTVTNGQYI